eukprot:766532-Hanusia_phi.AAC.2
MHRFGIGGKCLSPTKFYSSYLRSFQDHIPKALRGVSFQLSPTSAIMSSDSMPNSTFYRKEIHQGTGKDEHQEQQGCLSGCGRITESLLWFASNRQHREKANIKSTLIHLFVSLPQHSGPFLSRPFLSSEPSMTPSQRV